MKSEIDDLLQSMFRNGLLRTKNSRKTEDGKEEAQEAETVPTLEWDPGETAPDKARQNAAQAQEALSGTAKLGDALSASIGDSLEKLTKEAQAELAGLETRLREDGVESGSAGNGGAAKDLEAAFARARKEAGEAVLGQDGFLDSLTVAFKRPFVAGSAGDAPLCRGLVLGGRGTGRHSALTALAGSLGRQGVLKSPKLAFLDLSRYGDPGSEKLFLQDLYAALKSGASGLVFESFQQCHSSVLPLVSSLFREGRVPLPGRYAEQKGMLVDIGSALVPGAVSGLSGAGKYLFLLTDKSEAKLADAFGMPFLSALDDICETEPLAPPVLEQIAQKMLQKLCKQAEQKLGFRLTAEPSASKALAAGCIPGEGAASLRAGTDRLYKALSEAKLRQGLPGLTGTVFGEGGRLAVRYQTEPDGASGVIGAEEDDGDAARTAALEAVKQELSEIVGLKEIKEYILSLEDNFKIQQLRREKGLKAESPSMHMIFTGNPGTGKTTVARVVSRYLKAIGVLSGGQLIEVTRADLVGRYVGHTAPLTQKAIESALGGVLFIDEAYSLYRGRDDSFGLEAIDTLVKGMEDHRDSLVVILAGYSREMEEFLTANSGLRSRFPNIIEFPDYTAEELLKIAKSITKGKGYRLDPACDAPLLAYFEKAQREGDPRTNGNGRMARNKVEEAILNCSRRSVKTPEAQRDLELLLPEDFELE